jgi:hypothetical protein
MVGVILAPDGGVVQRIYSSPLGPVVQSALVRSADEAGMLATASNDTLEAALKETNEDYVLASRITRCWVNKHSATDAGSSSNLVAKLPVLTAFMRFEGHRSDGHLAPCWARYARFVCVANPSSRLGYAVSLALVREKSTGSECVQRLDDRSSLCLDQQSASDSASP